MLPRLPFIVFSLPHRTTSSPFSRSGKIVERIGRLASACGGGAHAGVLIGVCGDVGDEFLGSEGEEAGEGEGGGGGGKAGEEEVVGCYCVGDLRGVWGQQAVS